jgi:Uma2 family endonuclease
MGTTATSVPLEMYLHTAYRPDSEWIEGELRERNVGQFEHSNLQAELITYFRNQREQWKIRALPEQRIRVSANRYRVPDIVVIPLAQERKPVLTEAPLVIIEIMSPDDTAADLQDRCLEYLRNGTQKVWEFDPVRRRTWDVDEQGWHAVGSEDDSVKLRLDLIEIVPKQMFDLSAVAVAKQNCALQETV